ncbi:MAG: hypothetical protein PHC50_07280 [Candidatus Cloacimonetes bacterium]|nr:hypothetical protein [Candidatus Cloacimonadota bacterium]
MQDTFFKIRQIAALVVFIVVLSLMGMITGKPLMTLAYAGFFLLMSAVVFFTLRKKQRHFEVVHKDNRLFKKILAVILGLAGLITPLLVAQYSSVIALPAEMSGTMVVLLMLGLGILFGVLIGLTLFFINREKGSLGTTILGFVIFLIMAIIPGLLMSKVEMKPMAIGSVYYVVVAELVLVYNAIMLYVAKE